MQGVAPWGVAYTLPVSCRSVEVDVTIGVAMAEGGIQDPVGVEPTGHRAVSCIKGNMTNLLTIVVY